MSHETMPKSVLWVRVKGLPKSCSEKKSPDTTVSVSSTKAASRCTEETPTTTETETGTGESEPEGDAAAGEAVFASAGCGGCHTLEAAGSSGTVGPNLDDAKPAHDLVVERVTNGAGAMPAFKGQLDETQIQDVAAYVVASTQG